MRRGGGLRRSSHNSTASAVTTNGPNPATTGSKPNLRRSSPARDYVSQHWHGSACAARSDLTLSTSLDLRTPRTVIRRPFPQPSEATELRQRRPLPTTSARSVSDAACLSAAIADVLRDGHLAASLYGGAQRACHRDPPRALGR